MHGRRVRRIPGSYWIGPGGQAGAGSGATYRLPPHVFVCTHGRFTVFLDLRSDRYFAVDTLAGAPVLRRIEGWEERPTPPGDTAPGGDTADSPDAAAPRDAAAEGERLQRLTRSLLARGLLTPDRSVGKAFAVQRIERPEGDLLDVGLDGALPVSGRDIARFAAATLVAWAAFKCLPLERLVRRVSRRRTRREAHAGPFDPARAKRCAAAYERLRPLAFTARNACLFESLAFIEFAARYRLYPLWVFGVQATPFAAHCWVQHGSVVLNDSAEHAAAYVPIMVA